MSQAQVWLAVWSAALLLLGLFLGALWGWKRGAAEEREDARWARARQAGDLRAGIVMPYEPACRCPRGMKYHAMNCPAFPDQLQVPELAHEWEPVHVGQALALTRPGQAAAAFDVEAETARYAQVADEIIAWVHAASEPWVGP